MTFRILLPALTLAAALGAGAAQAHAPRLHPTNPFAALDAMGMAELAPARSLMRETLRNHGPRNRVVILSGPDLHEPEIPTRRSMTTIFGFGWMPVPIILNRSTPGCDVMRTPHGGIVEHCVGPMPRPMGPARSLDILRDLDLRLENF
jgi:hypothetical protein